MLLIKMIAHNSSNYYGFLALLSHFNTSPVAKYICNILLGA